MNKDVISPEELQNFKILENIDTSIIRVSTPSGQALPRLKLILRFRKLGPSPRGSELTTREDLIANIEVAEAAAHQIIGAIAQVKNR